MIIKKFTAKTKEEALEAARKELGDSIVTMNSKEIKPTGLFRMFKEKQVEVTVALEEESESLNRVVKSVSAIAQAPEKTKVVQANSQAIETKLDNIQNLIENRLNQEMPKSEEKEAAAPKPAEKKEEEKETRQDYEQEKFTKLLYNTLIDNEVDEKYANQIFNEVEKGNKPGMPMDFILAGIYQKMILKFGKSEGITPGVLGPKVIFFYGPTGVGKTTTIAKLASKLAIEDKKKVALVTSDTYRIAAAEQLKTYAGIMEVPFRVVYSEEEFRQAVVDFKNFEYIFVDTAGHSHQNGEKLTDMRNLIACMDEGTEYQSFLVLSATTKYRDLIRIVESYKQISNYELIFTKLDETMTIGNLLNIKLLTQTPIAYVTCGQNVPNDIEVFNPQKTVKILLGGKTE